MSLSSLICFRPRTFFKVFAKASTNPTHVERFRKHQQNRYRNHEVPERGAYTAERTQSSCGISSHDYGEEQGNTDTDKVYRVKRASFCSCGALLRSLRLILFSSGYNHSIVMWLPRLCLEPLHQPIRQLIG